VSDTQSRAPRPPDLTRRTLTPFGYALCVAVPILIAALGFTVLHFHYNKEQLVSGTKLPILTSDWKPGDASMTALLTGQLVLDGGCTYLTGADGSEQAVVWPADFEAAVQRVGSSDQLTVYDPNRDIVARGGDRIQFGGGSVPVGEYAGEKCAPESGDVLVVQSAIKVVGAE
jgi:hypothetical protein